MNALTTRSGRSRVLGIAATGIAFALALSSCAAGEDAGTAPDSEAPASADQSLSIALSVEPPAIAANGDLGGPANVVFGLIHRGLTKYDNDGEVVNALAETIESEGGQVYTVTLREGLTFSDDSPLTSANVKNSLLHWADPAAAAHSYAGMSWIDSIETPDDLTAVITLKGVNTSFEEYLADTAAPILPDAALEPGADAWVGAGPFELESWEQGLSMSLVKNESYFDADAVTLESIDLGFYTDATARLNALTSGSVDLVESVPWESFDTLEATEGVTLDAQTSMFQYLMFNVEQEGPLQDPLVREAIAYAINRDNSVDAGFYGHGAPLAGISGAGEEGENLWSYDPEKAKELLAEAGYPDGFSTKLLAFSGGFYQDLALSIQADLKEVGIDAELDLPDLATHQQRKFDGDYEITINGTYPTVSDPLVYLPALVVGGPKSLGRSAGYNNEELNAAIEAGQAETDEAARAEALDAVLDIIQKDVPVAMFNLREVGFAYTDDLVGFATLPRVSPFSSVTLENAYLTD
jgi:glutathione transport system substrate-binding protein